MTETHSFKKFTVILVKKESPTFKLCLNSIEKTCRVARFLFPFTNALRFVSREKYRKKEKEKEKEEENENKK